MSKPIIFVDMDGVLVDLVNGIANLTYHHSELPITDYQWDNIGCYELGVEFNINMDLVWPACGQHWWANLSWTKDGQQLWSHLNRIDARLIICTTASREAALAGKKVWVENNISPDQEIVFIKDKSLLAAAGRFLIDDNHMKCAAFNHLVGDGGYSGAGILMPRRWNSGHGILDSMSALDWTKSVLDSYSQLGAIHG
jgi:5'(3')-deoxyribonucleotidase